MNPPTGITDDALTASGSTQGNTSLLKDEILRDVRFPQIDGEKYYQPTTAGNANTDRTKQPVDQALDLQ